MSRLFPSSPLLCLFNLPAHSFIFPHLPSDLLVCARTPFKKNNNKKHPQHCNWCSHTARNLRVQQVLQPVDPQDIPGLVRTRLDSEGDRNGQVASSSQLSQPSELRQPSSTGNRPPRGAERLGFWPLLSPHCRPHTFKASGCLISPSWLLLFCLLCLCLSAEGPPPPTNPPVVFNHL